MAWSPIKEKKADTKGAAGKITELHPQMGQPSDKEGQGSKNDSAPRQADLQAGMELLEMDFLLGVVENTAGSDENDVQMRRLVFNELLRRNNQNEVDSNAMKVYAVDGSNLYGKYIQCEAMKELTKRTTTK